MTVMPVIPRAGSRKVNGYVKAVLALEAVCKKRDDRYARVVRPLDRRRDDLAAEVAKPLRALSGGGQLAAARRLVAMIAQATVSAGTANRGGDAIRLDHGQAAQRGRSEAGQQRTCRGR